jgi:type IV secretion system protein VirB1
MSPTSPLAELILACAPLIAPDTAMAVIEVESARNPWAIGVVGNALTRQPTSADEALATAHALRSQGWDFSVGLAQINQRNFPRLGLTVDSAFDPCTNLQAMQTLLVDCFARAERPRSPALPVDEQATASPQRHRLYRALSCYYSGNFHTGLQPDLPGRAAYVDRVLAARPHNRTRGSPPPH